MNMSDIVSFENSLKSKVKLVNYVQILIETIHIPFTQIS